MLRKSVEAPAILCLHLFANPCFGSIITFGTIIMSV